MLARVGLGRRRTRRAHLVELVGIVAVAALAAVAGVLVLSRLGALGLDPRAPVAPALQLRVGASGLATLLLAPRSRAWSWARSRPAGQGRRSDDGSVLRADV